MIFGTRKVVAVLLVGFAGSGFATAGPRMTFGRYFGIGHSAGYHAQTGCQFGCCIPGTAQGNLTTFPIPRSWGYGSTSVPTYYAPARSVIHATTPTILQPPSEVESQP